MLDGPRRQHGHAVSSVMSSSARARARRCCMIAAEELDMGMDQISHARLDTSTDPLQRNCGRQSRDTNRRLQFVRAAGATAKQALARPRVDESRRPGREPERRQGRRLGRRQDRHLRRAHRRTSSSTSRSRKRCSATTWECFSASCVQAWSPASPQRSLSISTSSSGSPSHESTSRHGHRSARV